VVPPIAASPPSNQPDLGQASPAELETFALRSLAALHERRGLVAGPAGPGTDPDSPIRENRRQVGIGIANVRRLLPLARRLTVQAIGSVQTERGLKPTGSSIEARLINDVNRIRLDETIGNRAEVLEGRPHEILIGSDYALYLNSDDEALFLLGHELTHIAVRGGRLDPLISAVADTARRSAQVDPSDRQKEDLVCDYIGAEVLKLFVEISPAEAPEANRFARVFGYETRTERLMAAWEGFCDVYNGGSGDDEHLSQRQTFRALVALDQRFKSTEPEFSDPTSFCR
jgi:hypothetical protein